MPVGHSRKHDDPHEKEKRITLADPIWRVYGILKSEGSTDDWIRETRGEPRGLAFGGAAMKKPVEEAVLSEKGQVTIPKRIRDRAGMRPGQKLQFLEDRGTVLIRKTPDRPDPVDRARGLLKHLNKTTDEIMRELRGDPELP